MFIAIYRWRVKPGMEHQFQTSWERVTRAIRLNCGCYGSRLHRCHDGTWLGYAQWPDAETRSACQHGDEAGARLMQDAIESLVEEVVGEVACDLLLASTRD